MKPTLSLPALVAIFFALTSASTLGQHQEHDHSNPCGLHDAGRALFLSRPELRALSSAAEAQLQAETQNAARVESRAEVLIIPIVFHIIHFNGPENISNAQIHDAVDVLNTNMRALNDNIGDVIPEFEDLVADIEIEFRLAQRDPQGNCHPGINRVVSELTYAGDSEMKQLIQWPRNKYLNVWVCEDAAGAAGYTQYPQWVQGAPEEDGIVIQHSYTGSIGTSNAFRSRTLTHEVGHWLNLRHPWGNSNNPGLAENCEQDDLVDDTPNTMGWTSCDLEGTTCGSLDNVQNYMDYSYCGRMFTLGQKDRMRAAALSSVAQRNQLSSASNLEATGVAGADILCEASFDVDRKTICLGDSVRFTDASFHSPTSWSWEFGDGTSFAGQSEEGADELYHVYNEPGVYDVTLTVGNGIDEVSTTLNQAVYVMDAGELDLPLEQGFEMGQYPSEGWSTLDVLGDGTWEVTDAASAAGERSLFLANYSNSVEGNTDLLRSSTIDMSEADEVYVSYAWSYVHKGSGANAETDDRLRISVSGDCGGDWDLRKMHRGFTSLPTSTPTPFPWTPSGPEDWASSSIVLDQEVYLTEFFRVQFEFEGRLGNNVYLDNINIYSLGTTELSELNHDLVKAWRLMPNPATERSQLAFSTLTDGDAQLTVRDAAGRLIEEQGHWLGRGEHEWSLSAPSAPGVYFIQLNTAGQAHRTWRWVIH